MALTDADRLAGGYARQAKWRERQLAEVELAEAVTEVVAPLQRENLGAEFLRMAHKLANAASSAEVEVTTALERKQTAETAQILHKLARLELGESTANTMTFAVGGDRDARLTDLRARLEAVDGQAEAGTQG